MNIKIILAVVFLAISALIVFAKITNKKVLFVVGILVMVVLLIFVFGKIISQNNNVENISVDRKNLLEQKLNEWKPDKYKPMDFGVYHVFASDDIFVKTNAEVDTKMLDVLLETDANIVVLYIRPKSYFSQKERYDNLLVKIREKNKKLFIGARFEDEAMTFDEYSKESENYTKNIIAELKPDYYGVVIEPATMEAKHGFDVTDENWVKLVKKISKLSKQLSSNTKIVADGHKEELGFLKLVASVEEVDIVGFNIYGAEGIYSEYSGHLGEGDAVGDVIDYANSKRKETWMLETWTNFKSDKAMDQKVDAKWILAMTYYAQMHNMSAVVPFFTGKFVYYGMDQKEFLQALNSDQRTPAFDMYKSVIEEVKSGQSKK